METNEKENRDCGITIEDVMEKIHANVREGPDPGRRLSDPGFPGNHMPDPEVMSRERQNLQRDISFVRMNWDIRNTLYCITSHRPYVGKFLIRGRQIVHGEVRRYIDPVIANQTEFNARVAQILSEVSREEPEFERRLTGQIEESIQETLHRFESFEQYNRHTLEMERSRIDQFISSTQGKMEQDLASHLEIIDTQGREIESKLNLSIEHRFDELIAVWEKDQRSWTGIKNILRERRECATGSRELSVYDKLGSINYQHFEDRFRGTRDIIKTRQESFLPFYQDCSRVLDIGCGRGEFLEILKNQGIHGIGIDLDPDMVAGCRMRQLDVEKGDAIEYLESQEDCSFDGIFLDQVVEHLEPDYLIRLLSLCHQKLHDGSYLVVETVNPQSFVSLANFFIDLTHVRPVHPDTLEYLFSAVGFHDCKKIFSSPVPDSLRLFPMLECPGVDEREKKNIEIYNHNINLLNTVLFGAQDFAIIGKK